ncbi:hydroxyethylthiazole kinase [Cumulibacter manganitolerans]|uniref:hydroxyethylthiazole kinase n=1 Tax=Cumulibacter manganitolerans TaxID=1884992 RepID=UPI00129681FB|nr:hydroxyethylthiazole kinase [Cumulibacter manganitolerans]
MTDGMRAEVAATLTALRESAPLVHAITGSVSQGLVADGLLAAGARPMMTDTRREAPRLVTTADALLVNLGSLSSDATSGIRPTVEKARAHRVPWVLDPTAIGIAPVRTPMARALLRLGPTAVRGNASEVLTLIEGGASGRGTDSTVTPEAAAVAARRLASQSGCVVAVSGPVDLITDGDGVVRVASGRSMLTKVSGTGCLLGGLTAACVAAISGPKPPPRATPLGAVVAATALLTVAAERAGDLPPGSFRIGLLDALHAVDSDEIAEAVDLR